ncbi:MAG: GNAT family N-acetyltransferase, partial [Clostridia bacterium]|nr:GNAT family N-acetyltransferase [Clostridia bacterium]
DTGVKGYAMLAKSFSTEFGKPCIWVEDLYISPEYRSMGMGSAFFELIEAKYPDCIFRLEVEEENEGAVRLYRKNGFTVLPYTEMKK